MEKNQSRKICKQSTSYEQPETSIFNKAAIS